MDFKKQHFSLGLALVLLVMLLDSCITKKKKMVLLAQKQLTHDAKGHFLNYSQCFSPDGNWLVYDTRNDDTKIGITPTIEMVNVHTGETRLLYQTHNQSEYGPGVGAASFSPVAEKVIFIQGIRNSDQEKPYGPTRRTGIAINVAQPNVPIFMDARNTVAPFTTGALRGGTHAHQWSGDGKWISFTYNDERMAQLGKSDTTIKDLRTVGVMFPQKVIVTDDLENNSGTMFAVVVAAVTTDPKPGSDQIDRAFDETWIGTNGYDKADGKKQERAIAFQGNVKDENGKTKTEIFVVDLPNDLTKAKPGKPLEGMADSRPNVPAGVKQRRISFTKNGVMGPRHWLKSTPNGDMIVFLSKDSAGFINAFGISPNGGIARKLTFHRSDIQSGLNFSPDGKHFAYFAENTLFITEEATGRSEKLIADFPTGSKLSGAPVWSPNGKTIAYNRYVNNKEGNYLQIFLLNLL